jgi:predicted integral membrane protein DUF2275/putative zinc finger protein
MNCEDVQAGLSDYLDQSLDEVSRKSIESHLSSCLLCRTDAHALAACIREVASLPMVDPPLGFAQRIMAHVREIKSQPSVWERFFYPLRIKVPIHATTVVLVGILAVYLFETENTQKNLLPTSQPVASHGEKKNTVKTQAAENSSLASNQSSQSHSDRRSSATPKQDRERDQKSAGKVFQPGTTQSARHESTQAESRRSKVAENAIGATPVSNEIPQQSPQPLPPFEPRARGVISGTPVVNSTMGLPRIGAGPFSLPFPLEGGAFRSRPPTLEPLADYELIVRRQPPQEGQTRSDNPGTAAAERQPAVSGGIDRLMEMVADSTRPQTVWVTLAQSQFEQFKRDLVSLGTIESESATSFRDPEFISKTDAEILVKLTILPMTDAIRPSPDSQNNR